MPSEMNPTIYVITEDVSVAERGFTIETALVKTFGYFTEPPEELVDRLNDEYKEVDPEYGERFKSIPLNCKHESIEEYKPDPERLESAKKLEQWLKDLRQLEGSEIKIQQWLQDNPYPQP